MGRLAALEVSAGPEQLEVVTVSLLSLRAEDAYHKTGLGIRVRAEGNPAERRGHASMWSLRWARPCAMTRPVLPKALVHTGQASGELRTVMLLRDLMIKIRLHQRLERSQAP